MARLLIRARVTPNSLTFVGFLLTVGAGYCLARGAVERVPYFRGEDGPAGFWPLAAGVLLILAGACDMLDGAVARLGKLSSRFGAILDSSLDRFSDMAVYIGCLLYFAMRGNITYQVLAVVALCNAFLISYLKARAENIIPDCSVGYWARGERFAAILIGCLSGHVPAVLWQQAVLPFFTVLRRLGHAHQVVSAPGGRQRAPSRGPGPGWRVWLRPWRCPRGSIPYDLVTGFNIAFILFAPWVFPALLATGAAADPLGELLR